MQLTKEPLAMQHLEINYPHQLGNNSPPPPRISNYTSPGLEKEIIRPEMGNP